MNLAQALRAERTKQKVLGVSPEPEGVGRREVRDFGQNEQNETECVGLLLLPHFENSVNSVKKSGFAGQAFFFFSTF